MIINDELRQNFSKILRLTDIDEREIQTLSEICEYLKSIPPLDETIKEIFISNDQESENPDLYIFTDVLQIRIPTFLKFNPDSYEVPGINRKTTYEITPIGKRITSICIEKSPKIVKIEYEIKRGNKFKLVGKFDNSLHLESILKSTIIPNLVKMG